MAKRRKLKISILLMALLIAAGLAGAAWLGYLPFGKPDNAQDFMARQLVRVRYGGPFRTDNERAISDLMPLAADTDDLRRAYYRHTFETHCRLARDFVAANPAYAADPLPPLDEVASAAFAKAGTLAKSLEDKYGFTYWDWDDFSTHAAGPATRANILRDSADLMPLLAQARPAAGKTLASRDPMFGDLKLPEQFSLPARAALARAWCLSADGRPEQAVAVLMEVSGFALAQSWSGLLMGSLLQVIQVGLVYEKGVLPFVAKGLLSADDLRDLSDHTRLAEFDPLQSAEMEFRFGLLFFAQSNGFHEMDLEVAKTMAQVDFEEYGSTSLDDWLERQTLACAGGWPAIKDFHDRYAAKGRDLLDPDKAATFLAAEEETEALDGQIKALRQAVAARAEIEAYLVATKLYEMRLRYPKDWQFDSNQATEFSSLLIALPRNDTVEVRASMVHPLLRKDMSGKLLVTVR